MKKNTPYTRLKLAIYLVHALFFSLMLLISGCGNGSYDQTDPEPVETASATFSITWHGAPDIQVQASNVHTSKKTLIKPQAIVTAQAEPEPVPVDCEFINHITCEVYDEHNNKLVSETFECSAHQGTVDYIPVGTNRKFVILATDAVGDILYHGEMPGKTITAGQINDLGAIDAYYFVPPDLSAVAVSTNRMDLSWSAFPENAGVKGYKIYRDGTFLKSVTSTSASDTGLNPSTQYCYQVSAFDAAGNESGRSSQACATTPQTVDVEAPKAPTGLIVTVVSDSRINLSWHASTDNVGVIGYNIYRNGTFLKSETSTSTSDSGFDQTTQYCYHVSAFDAAGNESGPSSQACETTLDTSAPVPNPMTWDVQPYATSTSEISMSATTASDPSTPIQYMFDFESSPNGGSGGSDSVWQNSTNYTDSGLNPNHQYGYRVLARDGVGNVTDYSSTLYAFTLVNTPGYPAGSPFSNITENSIRVSWTANGNPSGTEYYCERMDNGANSGWTTALNWGSTGLLCDTFYEFRVKARNGDRIETTWLNLDNQSTQICSIVIPDSSLEAVIRAEIGKPTGDILQTDLEAITHLSSENMEIPEIQSLEGLQYCINLTYLWLCFHQISDLGPLADLTQLDELWLYDNNISDISPIENLTNLTVLNLSINNGINDISPVSNMTKLERFSVQQDQVSIISPLANKPNLHALWLEGNQIEDIQALVDNGNSYTILNLSDNPLSETACLVHIPILESRSLELYHSCAEVSTPPDIFNPIDIVTGLNDYPDPEGGLPYSTFTLSFDYYDINGDANAEAGASLFVSYKFNDDESGDGHYFEDTSSEPLIGIYGYSGTVTFEAHRRFDDRTSVLITFILTDGAGNASNTLRLNVDRPDGAN